jgi:glycosyltransferase involved in cell wall biosynthesis
LETIIPILFFGAILIQLIYILFIFTKLSRHRDLESGEVLPPVSVIIASSNELENIRALLPLLDQQDYPNFEILVADDRSSDGTYDYLINNPDSIQHLSYLRVQDLPDHYTAKKYAVTLAVKKAKYPWLLFTDADCRPTSDQWIRQMVAQAAGNKEIVLGFSRYQYLPGRLNALIRYETFQTALQYLSFALAGIPFMGVGRNLMYKKDLFWRNGGFSGHNTLLSGDDDLFVNKASNHFNVSICTAESAQTVSEPKTTWKEWYVQKKRHLSVGKKYKTRDRVNLGLLWISGIMVWLLLLPTLFVLPAWFSAPEWSRIPVEFLAQYGIKHWYAFNDWMRLIGGVFFFYILVKWIVLAQVNKRLGNTINSWKIPFYDLAYTLYLVVLGIVTLFTNPQKIKWK